MWHSVLVLLITLTLDLLIAPGPAQAQPAKRVWRIGYLAASELPRSTLVDPLRDLGYIEGQNARFEIRTAENKLEQLPALAAELVRTPVDIIVAAGQPAIIAASQATSTIPIVMAFWGGDGLLESGMVASFARPGGNVTGVYMLASELDAKRCEFLLQAVPQARMVGLLNPGRGWNVAHLQRFAETRKIAFHMSNVPSPEGYDATFASLRQAGVGAVLVPVSLRFFRDQAKIIEAAAKHRIPVMYEWGDMARVGGLMGYGPVRADIHKRVAEFVHRIIKGAKPADMSIEQPTRFELVLNLKTAHALGLTLPPALLLQANEVIR